jgi:hypothetical protein
MGCIILGKKKHIKEFENVCLLLKEFIFNSDLRRRGKDLGLFYIRSANQMSARIWVVQPRAE